MGAREHCGKLVKDIKLTDGWQRWRERLMEKDSRRLVLCLSRDEELTCCWSGALWDLTVIEPLLCKIQSPQSPKHCQRLNPNVWWEHHYSTAHHAWCIIYMYCLPCCQDTQLFKKKGLRLFSCEICNYFNTEVKIMCVQLYVKLCLLVKVQWLNSVSIKLLLSVTLDHKTSHTGQLFWYWDLSIRKISFPLMYGLDNICKSGIWGCKII